MNAIRHVSSVQTPVLSRSQSVSASKLSSSGSNGAGKSKRLDSDIKEVGSQRMECVQNVQSLSPVPSLCETDSYCPMPYPGWSSDSKSDSKSSESHSDGSGSTSSASNVEGLTAYLDQREEELRAQLLAVKNGGLIPPYSQRKHKFILINHGPWLVQGDSYGTNCTSIDEGTGPNQRVTNCVKIHSLRIKQVWRIQPNAAFSSVNPIFPECKTVVFRDKVPTSPGNMPIILATDTNPPITTTPLFVRLGAGQTPWADRKAVLNPNTAGMYHIYHVDKVHGSELVGDVSLVSSSTDQTTWAMDGHAITKEYYIDCHGVKVLYSQLSGSLMPMVNAIWYVVRVDSGGVSAAPSPAPAGQPTDAQNGFGTYVYSTIDVEFEDVGVTSISE